jgi:uncharacterized membrane protein YdjX (TVP38/TMEM64 family)
MLTRQQRWTQTGIQLFRILSIVTLTFFVTAMPVFAADLTESTTQTFHLAQEFVESLMTKIQQLGAVGVLAFIALYVVATVALIPGSLLTLGAGAVYGVVQGSFYVLIGASLGAIAAFLIGRYLARDWVKQKIEANSQFQSIDRAVGQEGLKVVLLTRLSPIFPFTLLNYALGVTRVSLRDYSLGCVGMLPGTVLYVYIGSLAGNLANLEAGRAAANPWLQWGTRGLGLAATVAVTIYLTNLARQALAVSIADELPDSEKER